MAITLYRAPNCIRCRITHEFMDARGINYGSYDLEADKDIVNGFYRANRKFLHRNETGVEFPMFHDDDGDVVLQGTGVIIAYLLSGKALGDAGAVSESKMLHGWISGLNVSKVPAGEEEHFVELVTALAKGGLQVVIDSDGRNADLLEKLKGSKLPIYTIEELLKKAHEITGVPRHETKSGRPVGVVVYRDGTVIDTIRQAE